MTFAYAGHEIDVEVVGPPDGPPVLLLHGIAVDRRIVKAACDGVLGPSWQRHYLDLPGHGASRGNHDAATADDLTVAIAAYLEATFPARAVHLVGYSYGGYLAQALVHLLGPGRIAGMFLACPIVEPDLGRRRVPSRRVAVIEDGLTFVDDVARAAFAEIAVVQSGEVLRAFEAHVHPANLTCDRDFIARTRARYVSSLPFAGSLASLVCPVQIVCGRDDHWAGYEDALGIVRVARVARYDVVPNAGHLLPLEQPRIFEGLLREWAHRCAPSATPATGA